MKHTKRTKAPWTVGQAKWNILELYPLSSSEQCIHLLNKGYTLVNNQGFEVFLKPDGTQEMTNEKRSKLRNPYDFTHPTLWQVLDTENNKVIPWDTWGFRIATWLTR